MTKYRIIATNNNSIDNTAFKTGDIKIFQTKTYPLHILNLGEQSMNSLNYGKYKPVKDSFQAFLVSNAKFTAKEEYPIIPADMMSKNLPQKIMPFSKAINYHGDLTDTFICTYEADNSFERIRKNPQRYVSFFKRTAGIIGFDYSIHTDMPLIKQKSQINDNLSLTYYYGNSQNGRHGKKSSHINYAWAKDFNSRTLQDHFKRHGAQMNCNSKESYAAHSVKFANYVDKINCISFVDKKGSTYKYNIKTNTLAIITKKGYVITYFKPTAGYNYYKVEKRRNANND